MCKNINTKFKYGETHNIELTSCYFYNYRFSGIEFKNEVSQSMFFKWKVFIKFKKNKLEMWNSKKCEKSEIKISLLRDFQGIFLKKYSPSSRTGTLLPDFPNPKILELPENAPAEKVGLLNFFVK